MAYLIAERRCSAEAVFDELKRARPVCDPNLGYWVTLKEWEQQLGIEAEPPARTSPTTVPFCTSPAAVVGGKRAR